MRRFLTLLTTIAASLTALTACSGLKTLNFITPSSDYILNSDIAYKIDHKQKLDVYVPISPDKKNTVVVFFYGGSWQTGSKDQYKFVGQSLAKQGYITVIADYRKYPTVYFPAFMNDAANVLKWTHEHASDYGGNNNRIFVAGHSAGAHIAMLLTLDKSYIQHVKGKAEWIHGVIGIAGPYNFLPFTDPKIKALFSKVPDAQTQPITYVRKDVPPVLLLHGTDDKDVLPKNSLQLAEKLKSDDNDTTLITYQGIDHIDIILAMSKYFTHKADVLKDIKEFIAKK